MESQIGMEIWGTLDNIIEEFKYGEGYIIASANDSVANFVKNLRKWEKQISTKLDKFLVNEPEEEVPLELVEPEEDDIPIPRGEDDNPNQPKPDPPQNPTIPTKPKPPLDPPTDPPTTPDPPQNPDPPINPEPPIVNPNVGCTNPYGGFFYTPPSTQYTGTPEFGSEPVSMSGKVAAYVSLNADTLMAFHRYFSPQYCVTYDGGTKTVRTDDNFGFSGTHLSLPIPMSVQVPYARNSKQKRSIYTDEGENQVREWWNQPLSTDTVTSYTTAGDWRRTYWQGNHGGSVPVELEEFNVAMFDIEPPPQG